MCTVQSCTDDMKPVSLRSFIRIWKKALPLIVIQMPRSDLCLTCQQNTLKLSVLANMDDSIKAERIKQSLEHLNLVQQERLCYTDTIKKCRDVLNSHPTKNLTGNVVGSFSASSHISFDFAQQVHIPNLPDQPGPIYFLTPYKIGIFGIQNEAVGVQINYIIPESVVTGKGANSVISMVHHYLQNYTLGETVLYIHADNCVGQNKNNIVMQYLCWRILAGLNRVIKIMFLPVGHTKFSPDAGFGIIKSKFRRSQVCTISEMCDCVVASTPTTKMNRAQLVGGDENIDVPTFDWQTKFKDMNFKGIPSIKQQHHFSFSSTTPGSVVCKMELTAAEVTYKLINDIPNNETLQMLPQVVKPAGLSPERQWYLYEMIRPLVPEYARDMLCPKPSCNRVTFAQARAETSRATAVSSTITMKQTKKKPVKQVQESTDSETESEHSVRLPSPKRKQQTCSYCHEIGHTNRVLRGKFSCPKRFADNEDE